MTAHSAAAPADWQSALDRLYRLANWETRPPGSELSFELDRMRRLLAALGNPQSAWPALHVAGTNGKGSISAMLESVLRLAGYRVGLFTSPHLHSLRERIQVDGQPIPAEAVLDWLDRRAALLESEPHLTTFEALTALAFEHFASEGVDIAVVEVGLGGRLDTTNVVEPIVSAIAPVGMDHAAVLGDTLGAIARDKAGILRPGVPAAVAPQHPEALAVIREEAAMVGSPLVEVAETWRWSAIDPGQSAGSRVETGSGGHPRSGASESPDLEFGPLPEATGQRFRLESTDGHPARRYDIRLRLAGRFQQANAATAVTVLELLAAQGWRLDRAAIERGLAEARWPARFECFETGSVTGRPASPRLLIDGAHNPPAAEALVEALDHAFGERPRIWILGFSRDKDLRAVLATLLRRREPVLAIRAAHPRALPAAEVVALALPLASSAEACASPKEALDRAMALADRGSVIVATGSIFAAAELRMAWARMGGMPIPPHDPPLDMGPVLAAGG